MKTSLIKKVIIDCGKELNRDGKFNAMIINITRLSIAMGELNDTNKPCLTQMIVIENWWDGIGKWKAYMNKTSKLLKEKIPIYSKCQ